MPVPAELPTAEEEPRYRLAFDEAVRVLQQQRDDLAALQTRALALLSAGTLATAFLGGIRGLGLLRTAVRADSPDEAISTGLSLWQLGALVALFAVQRWWCFYSLSGGGSSCQMPGRTSTTSSLVRPGRSSRRLISQTRGRVQQRAATTGKWNDGRRNLRWRGTTGAGSGICRHSESAQIVR